MTQVVAADFNDIGSSIADLTAGASDASLGSSTLLGLLLTGPGTKRLQMRFGLFDRLGKDGACNFSLMAADMLSRVVDRAGDGYFPPTQNFMKISRCSGPYG